MNDEEYFKWRKKYLEDRANRYFCSYTWETGCLDLMAFGAGKTPYEALKMAENCTSDFHSFCTGRCTKRLHDKIIEESFVCPVRRNEDGLMDIVDDFYNDLEAQRNVPVERKYIGCGAFQCPICGNELSIVYDYCPYCGQKLKKE